MDQQQYSTLLEALGQVPDPRKARGKQLEWRLVLGVIASALVSHQQSARAMAQWAKQHAQPLLAHFQPKAGRVPSESTILRALRQLDVLGLEQQLAHFMEQRTQPEPGGAGGGGTRPRFAGQAVDGKAVRGARAHGQPTHLVSLVRHGSGDVLAQIAVAAKRNEISAVPRLLQGCDLQGVVITMDALLTQRKLARQILDLGGHYLMVVKRNQKGLFADLDWLFQIPSLPEDAHLWAEDRSMTKGHGRIETRILTCNADLGDYVDWPGVQQVLRRTCERIMVKTGEVTTSLSYGLTSLAPTDATPVQIAALWRGHWMIENGLHYVRDVTMGEDAGQIHTGDAPQALAALRNAIISLLRHHGWRNIADALRHYNNSVLDALRLISGPAPGL